jgi:hypothetical protein
MPLPEIAMPVVPASWEAWLQSTPTWITGLSGALLMLAGGRLYRLAVVAPGLLAGVLVALELPADLGPPTIAVAALILAGAGALICHLLERVAVHAIGAIALTGLVHLGWPLAAGEPAPWWGLVLGAALGLLLFPRVFRSLIRWITALLGALMVAWSLGYQDNPWVVGTLFLAGCVVQGASGKGKAQPAKAKQRSRGEEGEDEA